MSFLLITPILSAQNYSSKQQKHQGQILCVSGLSLIVASAVTFNKSTEPRVNIGVATVGLITTAIGIVQLRSNKQISVYALKCNKTITPGIKIRF